MISNRRLIKSIRFNLSKLLQEHLQWEGKEKKGKRKEEGEEEMGRYWGGRGGTGMGRGEEETFEKHMSTKRHQA